MAADEFPDSFSPARVIRLTLVLSLVGGLLWGLYRRSVPAGLSLTGTGAVAIINFRWLEMILARVLERENPRYDSGVLFRFIGRMAVLALLLAAVSLIPSVDGVGVALGYSTLVAAIVVEGSRT